MTTNDGRPVAVPDSSASGTALAPLSVPEAVHSQCWHTEIIAEQALTIALLRARLEIALDAQHTTSPANGLPAVETPTGKHFRRSTAPMPVGDIAQHPSL